MIAECHAFPQQDNRERYFINFMFNESDISMEEKSVNDVSAPAEVGEEEKIEGDDELVALDSLNTDENVDELTALDGDDTDETTNAGSDERIVVVGVRFKPNGKAYFFSPNLGAFYLFLLSNWHG